MQQVPRVQTIGHRSQICEQRVARDVLASHQRILQAAARMSCAHLRGYPAFLHHTCKCCTSPRNVNREPSGSRFISVPSRVLNALGCWPALIIVAYEKQRELTVY